MTYYFTLSFTYTFPHDDDVVYFSHSLPYTYTDLNEDMNRWMNVHERSGEVFLT